VAGKAIQHNTKRNDSTELLPSSVPKKWDVAPHGGPALPMDAEVAAPPSTFEAQAAATGSA